MATKKPHEPMPPQLRPAISAEPDDWIRQFIRHLEFHILDAGRELPRDASVTELQAATARAILETYLDSGMEFESAVELLGRVAIEWKSGGGAWGDAMNQRRFALIDREIQGTLTPAESVELAGLTRVMREEIDSETSLPMEGARALHRKLLELEPTGKPD